MPRRFKQTTSVMNDKRGKFESSFFEPEIDVPLMANRANTRMFSGWNRTSQQIAPKQGSSTGSSKVRLGELAALGAV